MRAEAPTLTFHCIVRTWSRQLKHLAAGVHRHHRLWPEGGPYPIPDMPKPTFSIPNHRVTTAAMAAQSQHHSLEPPLQGRSSSIPFPRSHHAGSMEQPKRRNRPNRWSLDGWACSSPAQPSQPCHGCPQLKPGTWPRTQTHAPHSLTHSVSVSSWSCPWSGSAPGSGKSCDLAPAPGLRDARGEPGLALSHPNAFLSVCMFVTVAAPCKLRHTK